ncbi:hypothetical protein SAMN02745216_00566 [Desulfatibacillum alkenivorans DSM 16219]|jgi:hypothetical protein|uniref:Nucleotidyltransferase domain-containing protein n=1 Tax=Desulfatibacillum alkenivorans DSM 16219 TaxID=1121393 RepID=A0A1M6E677_9BACT|nr:hypothetical protein [Desulfatibacillum alkenivorans]SHI80903.1 hypothetical protein SAMN02745216_00566 [Desulfatibacillum alkenivorans DSM 16219]
MEDLLKKAELLDEQARQVIQDVRLMESWKSVGATLNMVGSFAMGLMMNHRDIDCHVYTNPFSLPDSFLAVSKIAENPRVRSVNYINLLDAEDKCLEWHAVYEAPDGQAWKIDMIHILVDSVFAGHFEKVAERVSKALTPESRLAVLSIKNAMPADQNVMGIEIYQAVIQHGMRDIQSFLDWKARQPEAGIITWMP